MAIALRYVNKKGKVNERVIAIVRVGDTSTKMLKEIIFSVLMRHSLSTSKIHEQGYDGASNMQGEMNGLKALILQETPSAYCIHCFAHQLQLTLVAVVKKHFLVNDFFVIITNVLNVVGASFKRRDQLRDHQAEILEQLLESGETQSGKGLNQERGLKRPGDTRWGSHFRPLNNFIILSSSIAHVLDAIKCGGSNPNDRLQEGAFFTMINEFEFVFLLYLMLKILVMSNELSASLQTKEKDIGNAMIFLDITKTRLQLLRDDGWDALMNEVREFCDKHEILVPKMDDFYPPEKSKRRPSSVTYSHHLHVELLYAIIDLQLQELNNRFDVVSGNLLIGMTSLNLSNTFANFDKEKIMILAKHYPDEFGESKLQELSYQLDTFTIHMRHGDPVFSNLKGIGDLAEALVNANLVETYSLVYLLVKLTLILSVATATVERVFSSMRHIKNELRSSIGDAYLSDCLVCYIEKDIFVNISNDAIIDRFQNMKTRRCLV
ncbi:zinc finger MYM-type protein 1-like [Capsicum annuum]|uniref:zinc finger MYM-type protein 1-like n=1 Tax=Capsicum annuum TaxID=4072 RepID=UPI0007BEB4A9|nr:zinc finger MYM-type protein 1-like [Capsicum annuum]